MVHISSHSSFNILSSKTLPLNTMSKEERFDVVVVGAGKYAC